MSKIDIVKKFSDNDEKNTGKTEVQIAILNTEIKTITEHLKIHKKDFSTTRGLIKKVQHMYKLLYYLFTKNAAKYYDLIQMLGVKDIVKRKQKQ